VLIRRGKPGVYLLALPARMKDFTSPTKLSNVLQELTQCKWTPEIGKCGAFFVLGSERVFFD
jgi:hypothetical protein